MTQSADASPGVNVSATLTTGEAAQLLTRMCGHLRKSGGFSKQTVRRLITSGDLTFRWSRDEVTRDRRGREIHGHRLVERSSVEAYAAWLEKETQKAEQRRVSREARAERQRLATIRRVMKLRDDGLTPREIAEAVGRSAVMVHRIIREAERAAGVAGQGQSVPT